MGISGAGIDLDTDDTGVEESGIEIKGSGTADGFSVDETGIGIEVSSAVDVFCVDKTGLEVKDLGAIDGFCGYLQQSKVLAKSGMQVLTRTLKIRKSCDLRPQWNGSHPVSLQC